MHKTRCVGLLASIENKDKTAVCSSGKLSFTKPRAVTSGSFVLISFFNILCLRICCCLWLERSYLAWPRMAKLKALLAMGFGDDTSHLSPCFEISLHLKDKMNCAEDLISPKVTRVFSIVNLFYNNGYFSKYFFCPVMIFFFPFGIFFFSLKLEKKNSLDSSVGNSTVANSVILYLWQSKKRIGNGVERGRKPKPEKSTIIDLKAKSNQTTMRGEKSKRQILKPRNKSSCPFDNDGLIPPPLFKQIACKFFATFLSDFLLRLYLGGKKRKKPPQNNKNPSVWLSVTALLKLLWTCCCSGSLIRLMRCKTWCILTTLPGQITVSPRPTLPKVSSSLYRWSGRKQQRVKAPWSYTAGKCFREIENWRM